MVEESTQRKNDPRIKELYELFKLKYGTPEYVGYNEDGIHIKVKGLEIKVKIK